MIRLRGLASVVFVIIAGLGWRNYGIAAAVPAGTTSAPAPARWSASDDNARIQYSAGRYPELRSRSGEIHPIHSILLVPHPLAFGDYVWNASGVPAGRIWVRIDLATQLVSVFRGGNEIGTTLVIYGATNKPTPLGSFHILAKSQYYYSKTYNAPMPYALRLTNDGVAMHASNVRRRFATHGCIGLPTEFARMLFEAASKGDEVEILPANPT